MQVLLLFTLNRLFSSHSFKSNQAACGNNSSVPVYLRTIYPTMRGPLSGFFFLSTGLFTFVESFYIPCPPQI